MFLDGIFTLNDLESFSASLREPIDVKLNEKYRILALPPPSSGVLVSLILNIMNSNL